MTNTEVDAPGPVRVLLVGYDRSLRELKGLTDTLGLETAEQVMVAEVDQTAGRRAAGGGGRG